MRVLVVYASADGSTEEIAGRIADRLHERGHEVSVRPVVAAGSLGAVDAVVVGSAVHGRQWINEAAAFVDRNHALLGVLPFWTFSVGMPDALPRLVRRLARTEENGILAQLGDLRPRDHQLFSGVVRPSQFPLVSRIALRLVGGRYGDFRDWPAIDRWAATISDDLDSPAGPADPATTTR